MHKHYGREWCSLQLGRSQYILSLWAMLISIFSTIFFYFSAKECSTYTIKRGALTLSLAQTFLRFNWVWVGGNFVLCLANNLRQHQCKIAGIINKCYMHLKDCPRVHWKGTSKLTTASQKLVYDNTISSFVIHAGLILHHKWCYAINLAKSRQCSISMLVKAKKITK